MERTCKAHVDSYGLHILAETIGQWLGSSPQHLPILRWGSRYQYCSCADRGEVPGRNEQSRDCSRCCVSRSPSRAFQTRTGVLPREILPLQHCKATGQWTLTLTEQEMEQWASVMRKCVQYKRTEHWLATELCAYEERDAHLREANEKRKAKADEIQDNLEQDRDDDSDEEWDGLHHDTESMAEVRVYMNQLMKEHADAEKVREELKTKMDLIKETIQAERSEQNLRWCDAMRDLQDRMQEAGLLFSNFDAYREARNRIPAILRNSYMGGELPLQAWQHANIMEQRLDTASGPSSRSLIEPGIYTRDKVDRFNEAMLERNRAKYEFEQRHITYAHRKRKYEELVAQGLDVPTRTEFDREWVHELSRLTGDFIRAENDVVASKKSIKAFVAGSVLDGESIREPLSRRGNAAGEYLINEAHRSARILDWRSSLGRLASPESGRSPPATQYSADSLPFGFAESVTRDNEYRVSRANAFADLVMREEVHTVAWDVRVPGSEESAENRLPEVESKKTAKE